MDRLALTTKNEQQEVKIKQMRSKEQRIFRAFPRGREVVSTSIGAGSLVGAAELHTGSTCYCVVLWERAVCVILFPYYVEAQGGAKVPGIISRGMCLP